MSEVIRNPEIMGGTPVFRGTRVPATTLFDYLAGGSSLAEFLDDFPTVTKEQALAVLTEAQHAILGTTPALGTE